jgi:Bacterial nucleoid DNA-binding protein
MNEKLNIAELVSILAEKTGRERKVCERFVREFMMVVSDAIQEDKVVKVKGLGTFKSVDVEERESVNVNTGERFVIPEHTKISFSPDKELRELVNKPFSCFETTEINEGVVFQDEEQGEKPDEEVKTESEAKNDAATVAEVEDIPLTKIHEQYDNLKRNDEEENCKADENVQVKSKVYLIASLILIMIAGVGAFYYYNSHNQHKVGKGEEVALALTDTIQITESADTISADLLTVEDDFVEEKAPVEIKETIKQGSRLTLLSLKYYGHKVFWVYIYEHNKGIIQNPNSISIGTEIVIPDASLYGIDVTNPESVEKAKLLQTEINSGF